MYDNIFNIFAAPGDVVEVDTDEENDIVSKIRKEITLAVKGEITDEIKQLTNNGFVFILLSM